MSSALAKAAHRRFSPTYSFPQIIRYVADVRLTLEEDAHEVNPRVAEGLLRYALGDPTLSARPPFGADQVTMVRAQFCLLMALVFEDDPDDAELEEFVKDSAEYAAERLAAWQDTPPWTGSHSRMRALNRRPDELQRRRLDGRDR